MATYKSFTSLEQSKVLAEILPIDSADMYYPYFGDNEFGETPRVGKGMEFSGAKDIPCWSLAALMNVIKKTIGYTIYGIYGTNNTYVSCELGDKPWICETETYDNEIDACYDMILKLHEYYLL